MTKKDYIRPSHRKRIWDYWFLRASAYCIICISLIPVVYVFLWAFWGTSVVGVLSAAPTMQWVEQFVHDPAWLRASAYSIGVAAVAATTGTLVLVCFFFFARFASGLAYLASYAVMMVFLVSPPMLFALALRLCGGRVGLGEVGLLCLGQFVLALPVQYFILDSVQVRIPTGMLYAGTTLGASHWRILWFVYWPLVRPTAITAWAIGFLVALDELVVALIVIDSSLVTIPKKLWEEIPRSMDPIPAVVGTMFVLASVLGIAVAVCLQVLDIRRRNAASREP